MPPHLLYDITGIDLNRILHDQEEIRALNPQRGDMEHLNAIVHANGSLGQIIGYKDVREDEFWVPGHIPGNPLLPGVLMLEAGAQLASFYFHRYCGYSGFIGFSQSNEVRFRQPVRPGCRLYILGLKTGERHRRLFCKVQGLVSGNLVFEAEIVGSVL